MKRLAFLIISLLFAVFMTAQENNAIPTDVTSEIRISGTVTDKTSHQKMENASITVPNTNISTVTNDDGYFLLKLLKRPERIVISSLGYKTQTISITDDWTDGLKIRMTPAAINLPELNVWQSDPEVLVQLAIQRVNDNFVQTRELHTSFYRETLQKGSRFIDISEAILSTCKKGYNRGVLSDRVKVEHGRHIVSQKAKDTISVKVLGGPTTPVTLDAVKNEDILLYDIQHSCYAFDMGIPEELDGKTQIVILFHPRLIKDWALYNGKIYLDKQTLSFTRIEMSLDVSDQQKATRMMLYKKPAGLRFKPQQLTTVINYHDGRINYMKTLFRFKCDWKKRLFSHSYTCTSEMVVTDFETDYEGPGIESKERFGSKEVLGNAVDAFADAEFWKDYNIIEPTESLEKAINKLKKK